jgi:TonB-dependent starch-binding outer membrane protein SusC
MKSSYLSIILLLLCSFGFAQTYDVAGVVKESATGLPIAGVNILIKNTKTTALTDVDGKFSIKGIASGSKIVFSFIGFKSYEYTVTANNNKLNVVLKEEANSLEEVVVIGYGSKKRRDVTGSVAVVDSKTINTIKPIKIEQALQGNVAGINVTSGSGAPGSGFNIRIRGIATNGNNEPLTIIDGYVGELGLLNPNDVESITVLKDVQAAIYGARGANGVILITTKTGKKNGKTKVSFSTAMGMQESTRILPALSATEYALLLNESYANGGQTIPYTNVSNLGKGTNWQKEVLNAAPIVSHDISISGGSDKSTYAISGSHLDQEGIIGGDKSGFLRNTARIAFGTDLTEKLKINTNLIYTHLDSKSINASGLGSVLFNALNAPPTLSPYDVNGDYTLIPNTTGLGIEIINPLAQIADTYNSYNFKGLNGNFGIDYKVFNGFVLNASLGFNSFNSKGKDFYKQINYGGKVFDKVRSSVNQNAINNNNYSFDFYGTYTKKFGENHNLIATLGTTVYKGWGNGLFATGYDVPNNSWEFADIALTTGFVNAKTNGSYAYDERNLSYFGRMQYEFKGKYLFSAMLRRDGSTKFGPDNATAYFPSFTSGWIISDENFFKKTKWFDFLKLRASFGFLGNDKIDSNAFRSTLNGEATYVFDGNLVNGVAQGQISNPNLKWEAAKKIDVGFDIKMFDNKVNIVTDYFIDTRNDLLIQRTPVSGITGYNAAGAYAPTVNAGTVRNAGFEFSIDYKEKITDNLSVDLGYNVTTLKNKVIAVNNANAYIEGGSFGVGQLIPTRMQVGHEIGYFYGYKTDGVFQNQAEVNAHPSQAALGATASPGDLRYVDVNSDGVIDTKDRTDIGSAIPDATMGFNMQANYKNFSFSLYTFASVGNDMIRNYERTLSDVNRADYVLDRWTGEGSSNSTPRVTTAATANNVFSSYFVEDASFFRIQSIRVDYNLDATITEKMGLTKLALYAKVDNLHTFTKYKGFDPTMNTGDPISGGIDSGFYPTPRIITLGLNINF